MSLKYVIDEVASAVGLTSLDLNPDQRVWLLNKINRAAEELYKSDDLPGCKREFFIQAKSNIELALPPFVGELRAVREVITREPLRLLSMSPRYHSNPWVNEWRAFNYKGVSPVKVDIDNATPPVANIDTADSEVEVTIVGSTLIANRVSETVALSATSNAFTNAFTSYESITLNKLPASNITIVDGNNTELAVIFNDTLQARYALFDVSQYPYSSGTTSDCLIFEILYKLPLKRLENDSDNLPIEGFDNVLVMKSLQILTEGEEGKEQRAVAIFKKASMVTKQIVEDKTGTVEKVIKYPPRKTLGMFAPGSIWVSDR